MTLRVVVTLRVAVTVRVAVGVVMAMRVVVVETAADPEDMADRAEVGQVTHSHSLAQPSVPNQAKFSSRFRTLRIGVNPCACIPPA